METKVILWIVYAVTIPIAWYIFYGLEAGLNSGNLGRHWFFFPYQCAWQEFLWYMPGGEQRRIDFIKDKVDWSGGHDIVASGVICGSKRSWDYNDIRDQNLYLACANDVLPGRFHLSGYCLAALVWPMAVLLLVCVTRGIGR